MKFLTTNSCPFLQMSDSALSFLLTYFAQLLPCISSINNRGYMLKRMAQVGLTNKIKPSVSGQYHQYCPLVHSKTTILPFAFSCFSMFHFIIDFLISPCASHSYIFWSQTYSLSRYFRDAKG